jgi:hypothetical protein
VLCVRQASQLTPFDPFLLASCGREAIADGTGMGKNGKILVFRPFPALRGSYKQKHIKKVIERIEYSSSFFLFFVLFSEEEEKDNSN